MRPAGSRTSFGWGGDNNKNISSLLFVGGEKIGLKRRRVRPLLNIIWPKVAINLCWDTNLQRKIEAYFFLLLSTLMQTNTYVLLIKMSPISLRASGIENCWPKEKQKFAGRIMQKGKEFVSKIFSPQQLMTKGKPRKEAPDVGKEKWRARGRGFILCSFDVDTRQPNEAVAPGFAICSGGDQPNAASSIGSFF